MRQGHISVNPCAGIEPLKDKATHKKTFTPQQVSALLSAADGDWRGFVLVGFYCGMRLNDACNLRWRDIDLVSPINTITYQPRKTSEAVTVAVHPALEDYLLASPRQITRKYFVFHRWRNASTLARSPRPSAKSCTGRESHRALSANLTRKGVAFIATASTHCGIPSRQSSPTTTSLKKSGCD